MDEYKFYLAGEWSEGAGDTADDVSPVDNQPFARVYLAGKEDVEHALAAAVAAQKDWKKTTARERGRILYRAADYLEANSERFCEVMIRETGCTYIKIAAEIADTANLMRVAAGECARLDAKVIQEDAKDTLSYYVRQPLGVCVGISPFNYPLYLAIDKMAFAIAAGNAFILKPSSLTPISGLILAECFDHAGLPKGILSVLPGSGRTVGNTLIEDARVKAVAFTGSSAVGHEIAKKAAEGLKRFSLEMGGKNPLIVLKDADLSYAVETAAFGAYFHQGQVCMISSRIIVEEPIYAEFCQRLAERLRKMKIGDLHAADTDVGYLTDPNQWKVLDAHIADAVGKGATLMLGGQHTGNCYMPSLLKDVTPEMDVFYEESFGPLASVVCAKDAEEALRLANDNRYGLSSAVLTNDLNQALYFADNLEAGMVHINDSTICGSAIAPFGGVKASGFGREGSTFSMEEFTEVKWITIHKLM